MSIRITNSVMVQRQIEGLQSNLQAISKAQQQVSSGKRLTAASDDPVAASNIMSADTLIRGLDQYKTNVQRASDRVAAEDTAMQSLGDLLTRAQEIAVQQGTATATAQTRSAALQEVQGLLASAASVGNTKFGEEFLFGGDAATTAPFTASGLTYTSTNPTGGRTISINDGESMNIAHNGTQVLVNTGVLSSIKQLGDALNANDQAAVGTAMTSIQDALSNVQGLVGDVGARGNQLSMTSNSIDAQKNLLATAKSNLEDVDSAAAITELSTRQTAYQAALLAVSKSTGLTLTDYLR
jgi:flagellar hook-associated protein 3 FlgL